MRKTRTNQPKSPSAEELDLILKAVDELRSRQVAKESLLEFARYAVPGYQCSSRMHLELADRLQRVESGEIKRLMVNAPRRHGKQLADSTPMLTANRGWTTHGELRWGDYVFGLDGKPVRVLAVSQPSEQDWEVEFSNGATLQAHAAHEWQLRSRPCGRNIVVETQWLAGINRNGNRRVLIQERHGLFLLPKRAALEYPQQSLPLHPYVLGVWLGDGRTTKPDICYSRKDAAVFHKLVHLCGQPSWQATHKTTGVEYAGWKTWREPLWSLGLLRKSPKRIPRQYLQGSVTQRMDLLAGLLDTDGHTEAGGCRVRIATVSDGLRDDIMELVRGLGMEPHCYTQAAALSSSGIQGRRPVHYIGFSCLVRPPLALERKQPSIVNAKGKTVSVRAVRKVPPVIGRCIQVDAADGLYLAGKELLPTHNSLMVSQIFPCWLMGRRPLIRVVQCGYAESLTVSHSRKARDLFATERFHNVFPSVTHRPGTEGQRSVAISRQTAHEWGTEDGGSYYAVGVGGGLAGRGFHVGIIDDFYKSRSEANSITVRDKVHDWYRSVFYPAQDEDEIFPGAAIIVTATRWHVSDLTAQILRAEEDWVQLSHKAIDEDGQALWPSRWPVEKLMRIKAAIGSAEFSAQYQQSPRDAEGGVFRREWFDGKYLDSVPQVRGGKWCRFWDLAGTEQSAKSSDPDWTVGCLGLMHEGIFYLCHMRRFRATELTIQAAVRECAQSDPPGTRIRIEQEPGSGSKNLIANYTRMLVGYDVRGVPSQKDKVVRAAALSAYSEAGNVRLVRGAWNETFLSEAETMPTGEHDDTCDSATGCFNELSTGGGKAQVEGFERPGASRPFSRASGVWG